MKILVMSDSHMFNDHMKRITDKYIDSVDLLIHCGDSSLPMNSHLLEPFDIVVKGNHDLEDFPIYQKYDDICVTHGHYFQVYGGYDELVKLCHEQKCRICLHGHTHVPTYQVHEGITFINPGSIMMNRGSYGHGTYAILDTKDDQINVKYYHHETDKICDFSIIEEGYELLQEFQKIVKKSKI